MSDPKRKKTCLNLQQKCEVLKKLDEGTTSSALTKEYSVAKSTISYIKKHKDEILSQATSPQTNIGKKNVRPAEYPELEKKLYEWFLSQRERNCQLNGNILKVKAKELFHKVYPDKEDNEFQASDGWFHKFKKRMGMRILKIAGEKLDADVSAVEPYIRKLNAKIAEMDVTEEQIYNADETALYYRLLPEKTYVSSNEKSAAGHKKSKDRITLLLCANASGTHKINPLIIGKSKSPRCFAQFKNPFDYDNSLNAWMTTNIFKKWFNGSFTNQVHIISPNSFT